MPTLDLTAVTVKYPQFTLGPLDLKLEPGLTGLIGPNGAGKTTLLSAIAGVLPIAEGSFFLNGHRTDEIRRRKVFAFFPSSDYYYPSATFGEHLAFLRHFYRETWSNDVQDELIKRFNIPLSLAIGSASSGTRSKFTLLLCFARQAEALVLDEPWNTLDPSARDEFDSELLRLRREQNPVIIVSSHELAQIQAVCSSAIFLAKGEIIAIRPLDNASSASNQSTLRDEYRLLMERAGRE
ncbi:MAG: ABC transporter ATP-binding protein [Candidatus Aquilonibacter sp.]